MQIPGGLVFSSQAGSEEEASKSEEDQKESQKEASDKEHGCEFSDGKTYWSL